MADPLAVIREAIELNGFKTRGEGLAALSAIEERLGQAEARDRALAAALSDPMCDGWTVARIREALAAISPTEESRP